jgi:hypothetical protein
MAFDANHFMIAVPTKAAIIGQPLPLYRALDVKRGFNLPQISILPIYTVKRMEPSLSFPVAPEMALNPLWLPTH